MSIIERPVIVHQLPVSTASRMEVLHKLQTVAEGSRPRFVLDCSTIQNLGSSEIYFLLCCLEEAMKNNGDVRLAGLKPLARASFHESALGRLFETYDSVESAIRSYQTQPTSTVPHIFENLGQETEFAA